jgi:hypothetical protein
MLATYDLLSQRRDGHTLLACTYFDAVNTLLYKNAKYKLSDIAPVTLFSKYDYAIAVSPNNPAQDFGQLVQYAKENPGKLNYGHLGIGSSQNIMAKKLEKVTGMSMTAIPYKGAADALQEVVAGRLDLFIGPPLVVMPLVQSKLVKILAVTGPERLSSAPDVPTLSEAGIPLVAFAWLGICAGSGTPEPIINLLNSNYYDFDCLARTHGGELLPEGGTARADSANKIVLDLEKLYDHSNDDLAYVAKYARAIQQQRGDYNGRVLSIRADDLRALAIVYDLSPTGLVERLTEAGVLVADPRSLFA